MPAPEQATNPPAQPAQPAQQAAVPSSGPNANPLDLFPQVVAFAILFNVVPLRAWLNMG